MNNPRSLSEEDWRSRLTAEQFQTLRQRGTDLAFNNKYYLNDETGIYYCAACGQELFSSEAKFDSHSGWPSFDDPVNKSNVILRPDHAYGMTRTEVNCESCGSHLGHLFTDGPKETTGLRYCINSSALNFKPREHHDGKQ